MGIRRKIYSGFVILGVMLLLSGVIAIYEFVNMRNRVSQAVTDNVTTINTVSLLLKVTDEYNFALLKSMGDTGAAAIPDINQDTRFTDYMEVAKNKYTDPSEINMADSVVFAYTAYIHVMKEAQLVWKGEYQSKRAWYFNRLYPVYMKLRGYIQQLMQLSQEALAENSKDLSHSFYRSLMPCVVAVGVGIVLVLLFNYFINYYFIRPLLSITKGIANYVMYRKSYTVHLESDDEIQDLNQNIAELIDINKKLSKQALIRDRKSE